MAPGRSTNSSDALEPKIQVVLDNQIERIALFGPRLPFPHSSQDPGCSGRVLEGISAPDLRRTNGTNDPARAMPRAQMGTQLGEAAIRPIG